MSALFPIQGGNKMTRILTGMRISAVENRRKYLHMKLYMEIHGNLLCRHWIPFGLIIL